MKGKCTSKLHEIERWFLYACVHIWRRLLDSSLPSHLKDWQFIIHNQWPPVKLAVKMSTRPQCWRKHPSTRIQTLEQIFQKCLMLTDYEQCSVKQFEQLGGNWCGPRFAEKFHKSLSGSKGSDRSSLAMFNSACATRSSPQYQLPRISQSLLRVR